MNKQFNAEYVINELEQIGLRVKQPISIYLIGGCSMSLRNLKTTTKDADIVFQNNNVCNIFTDALWGAGYLQPVKITDEYTKLETIKIYEKNDFRLDLFVRKVCGKLELSES